MLQGRAALMTGKTILPVRPELNGGSLPVVLWPYGNPAHAFGVSHHPRRLAIVTKFLNSTLAQPLSGIS